MYKRSELIAPVGICVSTSKNYEKIAKITVLPNIKRVNLAPEKSSLFTQDRRKWHYNVWLESTQDSKKYPPTIDGFRTALIESIAFNGRPVVIMCFQRRNTFIIPERDSSPVGLPVEFRRELIKQKKTNLARLVDSLLLAGGCEKVALTGKRLIEIAARYGLTKSSVQRVLAQVKKPLTTAQNDTNSPCTKSENSVTGAEGQE
jgi:hypothetical protein